jgi:zinc protease
MNSTTIHLVDKPDLSQATFMLGHTTIGEKSPNKLKLSLANYCFGGGHFSSRLMSKIRTTRGKTYGISSQPHFITDRGIFSISTTTRNEGAGEVLQNILEEYRTFVENGIAESELEGAKRFFIGHTAFELEGVGNVMDKILWLRSNERDNEYIERFDELVAGVSTSEVNSFLHDDFASDSFAIVAVGKRRDIEAQLTDIAPVETVHFRRA